MKIIDKPKLAIIIPVYNVAKYLPECLESFKRQTDKRFHVFAVNDGSTDNSLDVLQKYALCEWLTVLCKVNGGLSSARNYGLKFVPDEYKYVSFIDSDDFVSDNYVEVILTNMESTNADYLNAGFQEFDKNGFKLQLAPDERKILKHPLYRYFTFNTPRNVCDTWFCGTRVLSFNLIKHYSFNESLKSAEDLDFFIKVLPKVERGLQIPNIIYFYRLRKGSLSRNLSQINSDTCVCFTQLNIDDFPVDIKCNINDQRIKFELAHLRDDLCKGLNKNQFYERKIFIESLLPNTVKGRIKFKLQTLKLGYGFNYLLSLMANLNKKRRQTKKMDDYFD